MRNLFIVFMAIFFSFNSNVLAEDTLNYFANADCSRIEPQPTTAEYACRTILINHDTGKYYRFEMTPPDNRFVLCGWRMITAGENPSRFKMQSNEANNNFVGMSDARKGHKVFVRIQSRWVKVTDARETTRTYENCFVDGFSDTVQETGADVPPHNAAGCRRFTSSNRNRYVACR